MNKLKTIVYSILGTITLFALSIWYYFNHKEDIFKDKIENTKTQKESDMLEAELNKAKVKKDIKEKEARDLDEKLKQIEAKRKQLEQDIKNELDPKKIEKYWENN